MTVKDALKHIYYKIGIHTAPAGTLMGSLHSAIVNLYTGAKYATVKPPIPDNTLVIAFRITGGIGDHVIAVRYIRDLLKICGDFEFDIFSSRPKQVEWMLSSVKRPLRCYDESRVRPKLGHYPVVIWISTFVVLDDTPASWHGLNQANRKVTDICRRILEFRTKFHMYVEHHPHLDAAFARAALILGMDRMNVHHAISAIPYGGHRLELQTTSGTLEKFGLHGIRYITIHTGFDPNEVKRLTPGNMATKCYRRYNEVVKILRTRIPDLCVVQIGIASSSQRLPHVTKNLLDKTTLDEGAEILRHSSLHIDNEGGMVHLAACVGTKSCVVFGPTSVKFFSYADNLNLAPPVCGDCWWSTKDWLVNCPLGDIEPRCLAERSPQTIAETVIAELSTNHAMHAPTRRLAAANMES